MYDTKNNLLEGISCANWSFKHLGRKERAKRSERSLEMTKTFLTIVCYIKRYIPSCNFLFQSTYIFSCCNSLSGKFSFIWLFRTRGWMVLSNTS